jgi:hypothetical protein
MNADEARNKALEQRFPALALDCEDMLAIAVAEAVANKMVQTTVTLPGDMDIIPAILGLQREGYKVEVSSEHGILDSDLYVAPRFYVTVRW